MIYVSDLLKEYYPKFAGEVKEKYPEFYQTAEETRVVDWQDIWDKKNEKIMQRIGDDLEYGLFDKCECESRLDSISFIQGKVIAFRYNPPSSAALLHEIGHIHYKAGDEIWSDTYGGAETLFRLGFEGYPIKEKNIQNYIKLLELAYDYPKQVEREIVEIIYPSVKNYVAKGFYPICLITGWMPDRLLNGKYNHILGDLKNSFWANISADKYDLISFFAQITEGIKWKDSVWTIYAKRLGFIEKED